MLREASVAALDKTVEGQVSREPPPSAGGT